MRQIRRVVEEGIGMEVVAHVIQGHEDDDRTPKKVDGIDARPSRGRLVMTRGGLRVRRFEFQNGGGLQLIMHAPWWFCGSNKSNRLFVS
jgi:hypothetical protein